MKKAMNAPEVSLGQSFKKGYARGLSLTLSLLRSLSYRNQFIDFQSKSMDWFLYDNGLRHERVNVVLRTSRFRLINLFMTELLICENQSIDLFSKSMD